ncbi:MAG: phosphopyruvate hydratase, partial [Verrucomicrobiota bacterium]
MKIKNVDAFQIYDSRGNPTIEAVVTLENGVTGHGLVPSGASTGQFEALELRDGDQRKFRGKSVFKAIANVRGEIARTVAGRDVFDQRGLDESLVAMDGTSGKSRLGANAILGVSMAVAEAAARSLGKPLYEHLGGGTLLPLPEIQIIGGGAHAGWRTDIQDFLVMATGAQTYEETLEITFNVFHAVGEIMKERGKLYGAADEGGWWPEFTANEEALSTFIEAVDRVGYTPGKEVALSLDIASSDLYDEASGTYRLDLDDCTLTSDEFVDLMISWCRKYPVVSIEDPAADTDWAGWKRFYGGCGDRMQVIGDDLFTTNPTRIQEGIRRGVANAVLIKLNQIGTVT